LFDLKQFLVDNGDIVQWIKFQGWANFANIVSWLNFRKRHPDFVKIQNREFKIEDIKHSTSTQITNTYIQGRKYKIEIEISW